MTFSLSRRRLLEAGGTLGAGFAASALIPRFARASTFAAAGLPSTDNLMHASFADDPVIKRMAMQSIEAARSTGAKYADVRLIREDRRMTVAAEDARFKSHYIGVWQSMTIGVRALVGGYWGYASGTIWSLDEAARLGNEAVRQAKVATAGKSRVVDLAPVKNVANGHWDMPVGTDPVTVAWEELNDFARGVSAGMNGAPSDFSLYKWDRAFASTEGAYATQTTYRASAGSNPIISIPGSRIPSLTAAPAGWEYLRDYPFFDARDEFQAWSSAMTRAMPRSGAEPVVGRFPAVIVPELVAYFASSTIGRATEVDRMLGFRANDQGTSYLSDPLELLGVEKVASPIVSIQADRTATQGCATMRWDDEGVETSSYSLIDKGVLTDCITTRESASWLAPYYRRAGMAPMSRAAMVTRDNGPPETGTANLTFTPSATQTSIDDLCAQLPEKGYLMVPRNAGVYVDFQQRNVAGGCILIEVQKGKPVGAVSGSYMFRVPELWRNVVAVGDARTARTVGVEYGRDYMSWPATRSPLAHSVSAVPVRVKEMTFVTAGR